MAFTLVQTVTDKGSSLDAVQTFTDKVIFESSSLTDKNADNVRRAWEDKGVMAFRDGMAMGLLLALTYTL